MSDALLYALVFVVPALIVWPLLIWENERVWKREHKAESQRFMEMYDRTTASERVEARRQDRLSDSVQR